MKILISNELGTVDSDVELLKKSGYFDIEFFDKITESDADVIVGSIKTDSQSLNQYPNLKYLQILSAGYDSLDLDALKDRGIILANARGIYTKPIAEYIIGKTLVWAKKDHVMYQQQKEKSWIKHEEEIVELTGKTVTILGTGSIGQETARLFKAFECHTIGVNTSGHLVDYFDEAYALKDLNSVLAKSDIVVCTLPLSKETYHLLGKEQFLAMKKETLFINIGRGPEVNEKELLEILDDHLSQVIMDVFEKEPLPMESPLWNHPKVIVTPHNSAVSDLITNRRKTFVLKNLAHYADKEEIENRIV